MPRIADRGRMKFEMADNGDRWLCPMGRWSNNFEPLHNSIASAIGSRQSYLEIPFVISSRGATTMLGYVFVEPRARLVSSRRGGRMLSLHCLQLRAINVFHQRILYV